MKKLYIIIFFLSSGNVLFGNQHGCSSLGLWPHHYQEIVINGKTICPMFVGQQCEPRYAAIKKIVSLYKRPVTVLDLGAAEGYMTFKLAHDFPASVFVMIEGSSRDLLRLCHLNNKKNIIYLNKFMTVEGLKLLAACEHFDIVICQNVLHHFGANWKTGLDNLSLLGEKIIIETPPPGSTTQWDTEMNVTMRERCSKILCSIPRWNRRQLTSYTYLIERKKEILEMSPLWKIISNYSQKYFEKYDSKGNPISRIAYEVGIKLATYKKLNGIYPEAYHESKIIKR